MAFIRSILASAFLVAATAQDISGFAGKLAHSSNRAAVSFGDVLQGAAGALTGSGSGSGSSSGSSGANALVTGISLAQQVPECASSIQGQEGDINDAYNAVEPVLTDSQNQAAAADFALAVFKAYSSSTSDEMLMYKLYRIYQNKQTQTGAVSDAQQAAYEELTPECTDAFDSISRAYEMGRDYITGGDNVTCNNYESTDKRALMGLCVWPVDIALGSDNTTQYGNLTAEFTNYGTTVCNVTFFIRNIDNTSKLNPTWLPVTRRGYPNGIANGTRIRMNALVPWSNDLVAAGVFTIWDIYPGWFSCPNGYPSNITATTPAPTTSPVNVPVNSYRGVINTSPACFQTSTCRNSVAGLGAGTECSQYSQLLSSGCSVCGDETLDAVQQTCLAQCSESDCSLSSSGKQKKTTSPAPRTAVVSTLAVIPAIVMALAAMQM